MKCGHADIGHHLGCMHVVLIGYLYAGSTAKLSLALHPCLCILQAGLLRGALAKRAASRCGACLQAGLVDPGKPSL